MIFRRAKRALTTKALGDAGQRTAERFLRKKGFRIVQRNYRAKRGEIDLIMRNADTFVFVEVKRRKNSDFGSPVSQVKPAQRVRIVQAAQQFLAEHPPDASITTLRIDVLGVLDREGEKPEIEWIPNAFGIDR